MGAHFNIPLNLPHAGTIVHRMARRIAMKGPEFPPDADEVLKIINRLAEILQPYLMGGENPPEAEGQRVAEEALRLGRRFVAEIERLKWGDDPLGQCVRNLFECLEHGEEGAALALRAGEDPESAQRPT